MYARQIGVMGTYYYNLGLTNSDRVDVRQYFTECLSSSAEVYNRATTAMQTKGILVSPPILPVPEQVDFVEKQNFLTGWFGNRRPISIVETSMIFFNVQRNVLGNNLLTGFSQVADSKVSPFSDKLMMFHTVNLTSIGIAHYGAGLGVSARRDLSTHYTRLIAETTQYVEDGANVMIDNGWMEQPPLAPNRKELAKG